MTVRKRSYARESERDGDTHLLELATLFAQGVLRLHQQGHLPLGPDGLSPLTALETARQELELTADSRLSVTRG